MSPIWIKSEDGATESGRARESSGIDSKNLEIFFFFLFFLLTENNNFLDEQ